MCGARWFGFLGSSYERDCYVGLHPPKLRCPLKGTISIGNASSNHNFSGDMLVFRGSPQTTGPPNPTNLPLRSMVGNDVIWRTVCSNGRFPYLDVSGSWDQWFLIKGLKPILYKWGIPWGYNPLIWSLPTEVSRLHSREKLTCMEDTQKSMVSWKAGNSQPKHAYPQKLPPPEIRG